MNLKRSKKNYSIAWNFNIFYIFALYLLNFMFMFMETITKLWVWIKTLPIWLRAIVFILISALALIMSTAFVSCGTTRAVVHNGADGTSTEIRITTNNPTTVTTTPNVQLNTSKF